MRDIGFIIVGLTVVKWIERELSLVQTKLRIEGFEAADGN